MKLQSSRHGFEKFSTIKFQENPPAESIVVPCGKTDRHDETKCRFSQFCERALKTAIVVVVIVFSFIILNISITVSTDVQIRSKRVFQIDITRLSASFFSAVYEHLTVYCYLGVCSVYSSFFFIRNI